MAKRKEDIVADVVRCGGWVLVDGVWTVEEQAEPVAVEPEA